MLWVKSDIDSEQILVESPDIVTAIIQLQACKVLAITVYIEPANREALDKGIREIKKTIQTVQRRAGEAIKTVIIGDFNKHDQL